MFGGDECVPGGPYDVVVATLAVHTLAGHDKQEEEVLKEKYRYPLYSIYIRIHIHFLVRKIFASIFSVLKPGGHLLIGDHVGTWGLYKQVRYGKLSFFSASNVFCC